MDAIRQFWQARNARERMILLVGGSLLALMMLYAFAWKPISDQRMKLRTGLPELQSQAKKMVSEGQEVTRLKALAVPNPQGLRPTVEQSATAAGVRDKISSVETLDPQHARINISEVPFDTLMSWLGRMQQEHRVRVESGQIDAMPASGRVKANLVLVAPGGE